MPSRSARSARTWKKMDEVLRKIKQKGYWRIEIRPTKYLQTRIAGHSEIKALVERCAVRLRGWTYPHDDPRHMSDGRTWVECREPQEHLEFWRFYQSAQFIQFASLDEDRRGEIPEDFRQFKPPRNAHEAEPLLNVIGTLYTITEVMEFAARLAERGVLEPRMFVSVKLFGARGRKLSFEDPGRPLRACYACPVDQAPLADVITSPTELISRRHDLARDKTLELFGLFGWMNPSGSVLEEEQRRLLESDF